MKVETKRLMIFPLSYVQLKKYLKPNHLEAELNLLQNNRTVPSHLAEKIAKILSVIATESSTNFYYTLWIVIDKPRNVIVADLCFKGQPVNNEIEIGYGTYEEFQNCGYMSEAVDAVIKKIFETTDVESIYAETNIANIFSQKVLLRNHFVKITTEESNVKWRRTKK